MKAKQQKKQNIIFKIALGIFFVWMIISLLQLQQEKNNKSTVLAELDAQITSASRLNEELQNDTTNDELYLELQARNKGLAKPGESIYKEVPGGQ